MTDALHEYFFGIAVVVDEFGVDDLLVLANRHLPDDVDELCEVVLATRVVQPGLERLPNAPLTTRPHVQRPVR